jgi:hypothetical protein
MLFRIVSSSYGTWCTSAHVRSTYDRVLCLDLQAEHPRRPGQGDHLPRSLLRAHAIAQRRGVPAAHVASGEARCTNRVRMHCAAPCRPSVLLPSSVRAAGSPLMAICAPTYEAAAASSWCARSRPAASQPAERSHTRSRAPRWQILCVGHRSTNPSDQGSPEIVHSPDRLTRKLGPRPSPRPHGPCRPAEGTRAINCYIPYTQAGIHCMFLLCTKKKWYTPSRRRHNGTGPCCSGLHSPSSWSGS